MTATPSRAGLTPTLSRRDGTKAPLRAWSPAPWSCCLESQQRPLVSCLCPLGRHPTVPSGRTVNSLRWSPLSLAWPNRDPQHPPRTVSKVQFVFSHHLTHTEKLREEYRSPPISGI